MIHMFGRTRNHNRSSGTRQGHGASTFSSESPAISPTGRTGNFLQLRFLTWAGARCCTILLLLRRRSRDFGMGHRRCSWQGRGVLRLLDQLSDARWLVVSGFEVVAGLVLGVTFFASIKHFWHYAALVATTLAFERHRMSTRAGAERATLLSARGPAECKTLLQSHM